MNPEQIKQEVIDYILEANQNLIYILEQLALNKTPRAIAKEVPLTFQRIYQIKEQHKLFLNK